MFKMTERKWKKLLIWVSAYVNILAFVLVGGYLIKKDEDQDVKRSAKWAFLVSLVFIAFGAFLSFCSYIGGALNWYGNWVQKTYSVLSLLNNVGRIVAFVTCALFAVFKESPWPCICCLFGKCKNKEENAEETPAETVEEVVQEKEESKEEVATMVHATDKPGKVGQFFALVRDASKEAEAQAYAQAEPDMCKDLRRAYVIIEERGAISASALQRSMKISYTYAGAIVEGLVLIGALKKGKQGGSYTPEERIADLRKYF